MRASRRGRPDRLVSPDPGLLWLRRADLRPMPTRTSGRIRAGSPSATWALAIGMLSSGATSSAMGTIRADADLRREGHVRPDQPHAGAGITRQAPGVAWRRLMGWQQTGPLTLQRVRSTPRAEASHPASHSRTHFGAWSRHASAPTLTSQRVEPCQPLQVGLTTPDPPPAVTTGLNHRTVQVGGSGQWMACSLEANHCAAEASAETDDREKQQPTSTSRRSCSAVVKERPRRCST